MTHKLLREMAASITKDSTSVGKVSPLKTKVKNDSLLLQKAQVVEVGKPPTWSFTFFSIWRKSHRLEGGRLVDLKKTPRVAFPSMLVHPSVPSVLPEVGVLSA